MTQATLTFQNKQAAQEFATRWAFKSLMGYVISKTTVTVYNVTDDLKNWIDAYVAKMNGQV